MGDLLYVDSAFVYMGEGKDQVLLDCRNYTGNKSRMSMHSLDGQEFRVIPEFIETLAAKGPYNGQDTEPVARLLVVLLTARLVRTSQPVRVLEYGCTGGDLSWYLASMLGAFCEDSSLVCASDRMDPEWMERIAQAEQLPRVSFLAGDYGCLQLQRNYFDIVLINGTVDFMDPCKVIWDASKLVTENGLLLCYADHMSLLENVFNLFYEKRESYKPTPFASLLSAEARDRSWTDWGETVESDFDRRAEEHLTLAEGILVKAGTDREQIAGLLDELKQDCDTAVKLGKVEMKIQLLEQKGRLLDHALELAR